MIDGDAVRHRDADGVAQPPMADGAAVERPSGAAGPEPTALDPEAGMATAEYAIATVAAAGFAGLLIVILRSGEVRELLLGIIRSALAV
ncbi:DUF4244 domain-containing protein [Cellulomonas sp. ATA003]|uniref:DUF4244 domain-containing protein n=1 Tax=Cellulomonas sp. ATA003 TaxID=3073064 RepID=UPI0028731F2E|nr:DUF4244 domain-containing protein [Cellulomonas sp. ATA003]WNB85353.1 DUF4244 domain-containing protein [Cellulomonas sp. ATA003]